MLHLLRRETLARRNIFTVAPVCTVHALMAPCAAPAHPLQSERLLVQDVVQLHLGVGTGAALKRQPLESKASHHAHDVRSHAHAHWCCAGSTAQLGARRVSLRQIMELSYAAAAVALLVLAAAAPAAAITTNAPAVGDGWYRGCARAQQQTCMLR